jgi:SOS response regulatory protein OraA/RecX
MIIEANHEITTARVLRLALVNLENQEMTIAELRRQLFEVEKQDEEIALLDYAMWRKLGVK